MSSRGRLLGNLLLKPICCAITAQTHEVSGLDPAHIRAGVIPDAALEILSERLAQWLLALLKMTCAPFTP